MDGCLTLPWRHSKGNSCQLLSQSDDYTWLISCSVDCVSGSIRRETLGIGVFLSNCQENLKGWGKCVFFWSHPVPFSMYFVWLWWLESRVPLKYILPSLILCRHTSCSCLEKNIPAFNFRHSQSHSPSLRYPLLAAWARKDLSLLTADQGIEDSVNEIENV